MSDDAAARRTTPAATDARRWLAQIADAETDLKDFNERCDHIRDYYKFSKSKDRRRRRRFQLFYSTIETLKPAVYANAPKPTVQDRFKSGEAVSRILSEMLERSLDFNFDFCKYNRTLLKVRDEYLLYARGIARFTYKPIWKKDEIPDQLDDSAIEEGQESPAAEKKEDAGEADEGPSTANIPYAEKPTDAAPDGKVLDTETVTLDFVQRKDFIHPRCRVWEELPWIAFAGYLSEEQGRARFPNKWDDVPQNATDTDSGTSSSSDGRQSQKSKTLVYEIWDKTRNRCIWVTDGLDEPLEECAPYLNVDGFYPLPKPAYGVLTNDSLIPVPLYVFFQDQAEEIDGLTNRIAALQDSLKVVGFYPAGPEGQGSPEIETAVRPGVENKMIAVVSWAMFTAGGKGGVPVVFLPVEHIATVLKECVELRKQLIDDVHQITGISDIMRGDTDPDETASAQKLKSKWGGTRIKSMQDEMVRYARDCVEMAAQIMASHFELKTLMETANVQLPTDAEVEHVALKYKASMQAYQQQAQMAQQSGQPAPPPPPPPPDPGPTQEQVDTLRKNGVMRRYRLDIETNSTIAADEAMERTSRTAFIEQVSKFIVAWEPILQATPELAELASQLLLFGVRGFPVARELEEAIESAMKMIMQKAQAPKPAPMPSPEDQVKIQVETIKAQGESQRNAADVQIAGIKGQAEKAKADAAIQQTQLETQATALKTHGDMAKTAMDMRADAAGHANDMQAQDAKAKTLAQTTAMLEQKMVAKGALDTFKAPPRADGTPPSNDNPGPRAPKREFKIYRDPTTNRISGFGEA